MNVTETGNNWQLWFCTFFRRIPSTVLCGFCCHIWSDREMLTESKR